MEIIVNGPQDIADFYNLKGNYFPRRKIKRKKFFLG